MKKAIEKFICERVSQAVPAIYRQPLFGYARADDEIFRRFKTVIGEDHLLPQDLLPEAKTVLAFFVPFIKDISQDNREGEYSSRRWAETYAATNSLINDTLVELNGVLKAQGVSMAWLLPTYQFDKNRLKATWSHKHVAFACGLGQFGQNQLLVTAKGCGGRFGTAVLDIALEPSERPADTHSCMGQKGCNYCIKKCPVGALSPEGFDRHSCYRQCLANDSLFPDLDCVEVCGKCSTGPCAYIEFIEEGVAK